MMTKSKRVNQIGHADHKLRGRMSIESQTKFDSAYRDYVACEVNKGNMKWKSQPQYAFILFEKYVIPNL